MNASLDWPQTYGKVLTLMNYDAESRLSVSELSGSQSQDLSKISPL